MNKRSILRFLSLGLLAFGFSLSAKAQWKVYPLASKVDRATLPDTPLRTQGDSTQLNLPFWEDFSQQSMLPDTNRWMDNGQVVITRNTARNAPSRNVATFDGADASGAPYSTTSGTAIYTDSLLSRFIDLSNLSATQRGSLYLSFFWQKEGLGDLPDADDAIEVLARRNDGSWSQVWRRSGSEPDNPEFFRQEIIRLDSPEYFHPYFQLMFRSFGNPTGAFDTWHIDYIFLDTDRDEDDIYFSDWVINDFPGSILRPYSTIPLRHINGQVDRYLHRPAATTYSLASPLDAKPVSFNSLLYNMEDSSLIDAMDVSNGAVPRTDGSDSTGSHFGQQYRIMTSSRPDAAAIQTAIDAILDTADVNSFPSLRLRHEFQYVTGDGFRVDSLIDQGPGLPPDTVYETAVDYRVNDTVYREMVLGDVYAYDDGTAEFAVGINAAEGQIAVRYILAQPDFIRDIDIYFPIVGRTSNRTIQVELFDNEVVNGRHQPGRVLAQGQELSLGSPSGLNQFTRFRLSSSILVSDTIYVGFKQNGDERVAVGFDKNTDSFDEVLINLDGDWTSDTTLVGSLMIRPVFAVSQSVTARPARPAADLRIWPNPGRDRFFIEGNWEQLEVYNMNGQQIPWQLIDRSRGEVAVRATKGLYLFRLLTDAGWVAKRIAIEP